MVQVQITCPRRHWRDGQQELLGWAAPKGNLQRHASQCPQLLGGARAPKKKIVFPLPSERENSFLVCAPQRATHELKQFTAEAQRLTGNQRFPLRLRGEKPPSESPIRREPHSIAPQRSQRLRTVIMRVAKGQGVTRGGVVSKRRGEQQGGL